MSDWTGDAWSIGGGSKYTGVGVIPVNDCIGFTTAVIGDAFGNFWLFASDKGGTQHCANTIPLACCKVW